MKDLKSKSPWLGVVVAALGYFVDVYDLILFSIVRVPSLRDLGLEGDKLLSIGVILLNMQMAGMLVGGILWGIWGDRKGRLSVLFGSILLYSVANLLNGLVTSTAAYAALRFIAGVGLAGELGAGITLVSETLSKERRGYGTTCVATVGVLGAVVASLVAGTTSWRTAYFVGGIMGLALLALRVAVHESGMFLSIADKDVEKADLRLLLTPPRVWRYLGCIFVGLPIWFTVGIFITFAPEFGKALAMPILPEAGRAVLFAYVGLTIGDMACGLTSQWLKSRRHAMLIFLMIAVVAATFFVNAYGASLERFYFICAALGFGTGYWAVFVTTAAEQFGTNLRATVTTTVPNFVRGAVVPLTTAFVALKPAQGVIGSGLVVGMACLVLAVTSILAMSEPFAKDLNYLEKR